MEVSFCNSSIEAVVSGIENCPGVHHTLGHWNVGVITESTKLERDVRQNALDTNQKDWVCGAGLSGEDLMSYMNTTGPPPLP